MSNIVIQDNFLPVHEFESLRNDILQYDFPWYKSPIVDVNNDQDWQLCHNVYFENTFQSVLNVSPLLKKMSAFSLVKIKINMIKREQQIIEHEFHIDIAYAPDDMLTSILYLNTNNGYTKFKSGEKVESVANRLVTFPSMMMHTGTTNTCNSPYRMCMNINWFKNVPENDIKPEKTNNIL